MLRNALWLPTLLALATAPAAAAEDASAPATEANRKCDTAQRRVTKEESSLAATADELDRDQRGKESCATKGACARFEAAIKSMELRKAQHETRLAKFKSDAEQICKPP